MSKNGGSKAELATVASEALIETAGNFNPNELIEGGYKTTTRVKLAEGQWFSRDGLATYDGERAPVEFTNEKTGEVKYIRVHAFSYKGVDVEILGDAGLNSALKSITPGSLVKLYRGGQVDIAQGKRMNQYIVSAKSTPASEKYLTEQQKAKFNAAANRATA